MKKSIILLPLLFLLFISCETNKYGDNIYEFNSSPSFDTGFKLVINSKERTISFEEAYSVIMIDSVNSDGLMRSSGNFEFINTYSSRGLKITKELTNKEIRLFKNILDSINSSRLKPFNIRQSESLIFHIGSDGDTIKEEQIYIDENIAMEDGMSFHLSISDSISVDLGNVNCGSYKSKIIKELYVMIVNKFDNMYSVTNTIDNNLNYIECMPYYIISKNELYIKLFKDSSLNSLKENLNKLPNEDEIYIDLTNYKLIEMNYFKIKDIFKKKFRKVHFILDQNKKDFLYSKEFYDAQ